jgi:phage gpG-like protein
MWVKIKQDDVSPILAGLIKTARNPSPVTRAIGTTWLSITLGNFSSHGKEYRPVPWRNKADNKPCNLKSRHPQLSKSIRLTLGATWAKLSTDRPYAAIHQFGGHTRPRVIRAVKKKALAFTIQGRKLIRRSVNHPGSHMPERPFVPVYRGKLTTKAEQKMSAAARRVIERQAGLAASR